ncbi:ABC transporter substrate-binding protein [Paenibacillus hemerocallicola]|uniref:ABC transporter substrate-binding protein n=1 Tax=Paenibacillus hemerocallicola TaxID=1172614 RepID=A0A5C4T2W2_9BACL|nr:ABC transporter substrate-binding protein [Paenibacillus hemerocallicola]TNJ63216.1 ABC transporter substrate-binding protein [Paenibacillus hemerocallicola]
MLSRTKFGIMIVLCCLAMIVAGCNGSDKSAAASPVPQAAKASGPEQIPMLRLVWGNSGYPSPFAFSPSGPGGFLRSSFLFDTLTWKDEKGLIPWLAKSWKVSGDGLTYTFELEQGVQWHDGKPFTAEDVVFSFAYYKKYPFMWTGDIEQIKSVRKTGDYTVEFALNNKYAPFLTDLVGIVPIIPKHVWEKVDKPVEYRDPSALVGTGPYTLKQYDEKSGQYLYEANPNFFKGKVLVKEVAYVNAANKVLSMKKNEVDGGSTTSYPEVEQMQKEGFGVIKSAPTGSALRVTFNLDHPQLKDKRLRQAIAYALDRKEMAQKITGGEPIVGNAGIIPPDSPWYNPKVKNYAYDTAQAERILDELGYKKNAGGVRDGLKLSVMVSSTSQEAQMMVEMLKKVGIELTLRQADSATFSTAMGENKYDMAITGHIGLSGDPDYLRLWFLGKASNSLAARGKTFDNAEFQQFALQQIGELDPMKRKALVDSMQNILADELPTLVLYHRPFYYMFKKSVFDGYFNTYGGIADGIPLWDNKAAFIHESK